MPRHFLVKRHKLNMAAVSYRDASMEIKPLMKDDTAASLDTTRSVDTTNPTSNSTTSTTIIDTDKQLIIRDVDRLQDYYSNSYGSPDSGYAASPNSVHPCSNREKENVRIDLVNSSSSTAAASAAAAAVVAAAAAGRQPKQLPFLHDQLYSGRLNLHHLNFINNNLGYSGPHHPIYVTALPQDYDMETPMDLSMPTKRKSPDYEVSYKTDFRDNKQKPTVGEHYKQGYQEIMEDAFQHQHLSHPHVMPATTDFYPKPPKQLRIVSPTHPVSFTHPELRIITSQISPGYRDSNFTPPEITACDDSNKPASQHIIPQCISVPRASSLAPPVTTLSSPPPLIISRDQDATSFNFKPKTNPLVSTAISLASILSPSRKQSNPEDRSSCETTITSEFSKAFPGMPHMSSPGAIRSAPVTPKSKDPGSSIKSRNATAPLVKKSTTNTPNGKRLKAVRRLNFDIDTTSPVSGTIIKDASDFHPEEGRVVYGDIEPSYNLVEVTPEARAELDKIENKLGDYLCQLCKEIYPDAFQLAQHRCSRIVHVEYRCPECEKVFNCPANLASHRRWHKPRQGTNAKSNGASTKLSSGSQKIAPKPDCNGNSVTKETGPDLISSTNESAVSREMVRTTLENISTPSKLIQPQPNAQPGYPHIVSSPSILPAEKHHQEFRSSPILTEQNASQGKTMGSSLTAEERRLVLQVLTAHQQQQQQHSSTTITQSTTTVMTPFTSSFKQSKGSVARSINNNNDDEARDDIGNHVLSTDNSARFERLPFDSMPITSYREPSPLDLTHPHPNGTDNQLEPHILQHQNQTLAKDNGIDLSKQTESRFDCGVCGKKFLRQAYLRKHFQNQHGQFPKDLDTKLLTNGVSGEEELTHFTGRSSASPDDSSIQDLTSSAICQKCGKTFVSQSARLKHETLAHGLATQVTCGSCDLGFSSRAALEKHTRTMHSVQRFTCKWCGSNFHSSPGLTRHINKCHPTENRQVILLQLPAPRPC